MHHHQWRLDEQNAMVPWEREIMLAMLEQHIEEEKAKMKEQGIKV